MKALPLGLKGIFEMDHIWEWIMIETLWKFAIGKEFCGYEPAQEM